MKFLQLLIRAGTARRARFPGWLAALLALLIGASVWAAEPPRRSGPVLIGMLTYLWGATSDMVAVRDGLEELGYRNNEHFAVGARAAEGSEAKLAVIMGEFKDAGVDIVYASGWKALQAARRAGIGKPIVFASWYSFPRGGSLAALASPGGNVTGVVNRHGRVSPKALDAFRSLIPDLKRVLVPYDAGGPQAEAQMTALRSAAARLGIELIERPVRTKQQARRAIASLRRGEVDGIMPASNRLNIAGFALQASLRRRIPTMFSRAWMADYGGLAAYGPSWPGLGRQAARLVDKIIKGADAGKIPVVLNERMELVVNLRTAKALGIRIPPKALARAQRILR